MAEAGWPPDITAPPFAPFLVVTRHIALTEAKEAHA